MINFFQVFYPLTNADRVNMVLETACHELYLTTDLTANDIISQNNFKSFRVFLTYLKTRLSTTSSRVTHGAKLRNKIEQENLKQFSLNQLTTTTYRDVSIVKYT